MKRSFAVGGATLAFMFAIALSFGAQSADAQLLCRVKARCAATVNKCCKTPKLKLRTACCKTETEEPAKTCCKVRKLKLRTCCKAEEPAAEKTGCAPRNPCGMVSRLVAKLKAHLSTSCGCSGCEATPASEDAIPPAPEAAKKTT